jgi:hypothetical protein
VMMTPIDATRDGLALIAAADREDKQAVELMLSTYQGSGNEADRGQLVGAILAHSGAILRLASQTLGVSPDSILGSVARSLNDGK